MGDFVWLSSGVQRDIEFTLFLEQKHDTRHDWGGTTVRCELAW